MNDYRHSPPTVTRSLRTRDLIDSWEYFTLEMRLDMLGVPEDWDYFDVIRKAAVSITAYDGTRGNRSAFPAPIDFIDDFVGIEDEDHPAINVGISRYTTEMLRIVVKLKEEMDRISDRIIEGNIYAQCPICNEDTIYCDVGFIPIYIHKGGRLGLECGEHGAVVWTGERCIHSVNIHCSCRGFTVSDYDRIDDSAIEAYELREGIGEW